MKDSFMTRLCKIPHGNFVFACHDSFLFSTAFAQLRYERDKH